jgi:Fe-S-cluster containining protein
MSALPPTEPPRFFSAGPFGAWLAQMRAALRGTQGSSVACGDCTGCCTSGYSLQLRPDDTRALAVIPARLLHEAAGFAAGQQTLAARPDGTCQMLVAGRCSIYADRPQTCLDYDAASLRRRASMREAKTRP